MDRQIFRSKIYQFRFGDCIVTNILDGFFHRNDLHPFVATNASVAEVEALAEDYNLPYPALEHNFVCSIIETPDQLIVIDPGFGAAAPAPSTGWFMDQLQQAGYSAADVDVVAISHGHPDHIGNISNDGTLVFPNARIAIGRTEFEFWKAGENISEMRQPTLALFQKAILPLEDQLIMVEPGDEVVPGLRAVDAYGHSAGHLVFELETAGKKLLFLNDTTPHYVASFANPEWHFAMDDDPEKAATARRRILKSVSEDGLPIIGFHLPFPSIGFVKQKGNGFEFRPATYQFNLPTE